MAFGQKILTLLFSIGLFVSAWAQNEITSDTLNYYTADEEIEYHAPDDSTLLSARGFDKATLSEFKTNPDFDYKLAPTVAESLWDRFLQWLSQLLSAVFTGATMTNWGRVLVYAAAFVGFMAILLMILKVNAFRVFYSGADRGTVSTSIFHENIHEMDFDALIREALEKGKYRDGIRLLFLKSLKILTDKQLIYWQAGKTNHDYVEELSEGELKINFNELSFYFDYAWYGNFSVNEDTFHKTEELFNTLQQRVAAHA